LNELDYSPDGVVMLEPTAPLRQPADIDNCIQDFYNNKWDSGFSGAILEDFLIWKITSLHKIYTLLYQNHPFGKAICHKL
jgi:CMP-N-acetylneuraminic acid synthetase